VVSNVSDQLNFTKEQLRQVNYWYLEITISVYHQARLKHKTIFVFQRVSVASARKSLIHKLIGGTKETQAPRSYTHQERVSNFKIIHEFLRSFAPPKKYLSVVL
jgi:hypothetical protein